MTVKEAELLKKKSEKVVKLQEKLISIMNELEDIYDSRPHCFDLRNLDNWEEIADALSIIESAKKYNC